MGRAHRLLWIAGIFVTFAVAFWLGRKSGAPLAETGVQPVVPCGSVADTSRKDLQPTLVYAHNLLLRKGPDFRVYVRWIRGHMVRTRADQNPSFDVPDSFVLEIEKGVMDVKFEDIAAFLNAGPSESAPLKNVSITSTDGQVSLKGTAHKIVPLPVQLKGVVTPMPDGRLKYHLTKLSVLRLPLKGLLSTFHIELSDLVKNVVTPGVMISGNDIYFDTERLLPAPHIHGDITSVTSSPAGLQVIYGRAGNNEANLQQWHNFLQLTGGSLDFGKLTMRQVDLTMIDASKDPWFDLDLVNYQAQLVYGTTRITPKAGLEIYMPDLDNLPAKKAVEAVNMEWLRNRNTAPPVDVRPH